jgi:hypothetical protein
MKVTTTWNVLTEEHATEKLVNANASKVTLVLLVKFMLAQVDAPKKDPAKLLLPWLLLNQLFLPSLVQQVLSPVLPH